MCVLLWTYALCFSFIHWQTLRLISYLGK
jgi:hypothetical protein